MSCIDSTEQFLYKMLNNIPITESNRLLVSHVELPIYNDGLVLFLDIMGFKDRVLRTPHDQLDSQLREFKRQHDRLKRLMDRGSIELLHFSDSIIAVAHEANIFTLNRLVKMATVLMQVGLKNEFAMKGAIARGRVTFDTENQLYFGQALVDAYLMEEELKFYGVAFHHSAERLVIDALEKMYYPNGKTIRIFYPIHECTIPLKSCKCKHYLIAWHKLNNVLSQSDITETSKNWLAKINLTVSGSPRVYVDNTLALIDEINNTPMIESIENHRVKSAESKTKKQRKRFRSKK